MSVNTTHPAGQAFFDSITQQYADWGVDFIKNDCVFGNQFVPDQILAQSAAIERSGRPIIYSLSPGATDKGASGEETKLAMQISDKVNMYRVTGDDWDTWGAVDSHFAVADSFTRASLVGAKGLAGKSWPDLDMLPFGVVTSPGSGRLPYKNTSLTHNEQYSQMSLWAIAKSPLMFGGDATLLDEFTTALLGNSAVLEMNARATDSRQVIVSTNSVVWAASGVGLTYVSLFNRLERTASLTVSFASLGLSSVDNYTSVDLWTLAVCVIANGRVNVNVGAHGVALLHLTKCAVSGCVVEER
jgi:hypothetical protein